jgi:hypothetical protein
MEWVLVIGIALTGIGTLIGLYVPWLAVRLPTPEKMRVFLVAGAILIIVGIACQLTAVWPEPDVSVEPPNDD